MQLNLLVQPAAEVTVGTKVFYLYPPTMNDVGGYSGVGGDFDAMTKFRMLLTLVASLTLPGDYREKREPLSEEQAEAMSAEALEQLANAYVDIPYFDKVRTGNGGLAPVARYTDEPVASYLDRLMNAEAERQRRIFEKINSPS